MAKTRPVNYRDTRPNATSYTPGQCFYCDSKLGSDHKLTCAVLHRLVVIEFKCEIVVPVQQLDMPSAVEKRYSTRSGHTTWCADNAVQYLSDQSHLFGGRKECLCGVSSTKFLRNATEADIKRTGVKLED